MAKNKKLELSLDYKVIFLYAKAVLFLKEIGSSFEPDKQDIILLYSGKILNKEHLIGNYI